jgi:hypothetical protein
MRRKRLRQPKTVAVGCDRLPEAFYGKEGLTVRVRQRALGSMPHSGTKEAPRGASFSVQVRVRAEPSAYPLPLAATGSLERLVRAERTFDLRGDEQFDPETMREDELPSDRRRAALRIRRAAAALRHLKRNRTPQAAARIRRFRRNVLQRSLVQSR